MHATLLKKRGDDLVYKLEISKAELNTLSREELSLLLQELRDQCPKEETAVKASGSPSASAVEKPFIAAGYRGVVLENAAGSKESITERLLDKIIDENEFVLPAELQDEIDYVFRSNLQHMKYQQLFGGADIRDIDREKLLETITRDVTRDYKVEQVIKSVIQQERIDCTVDELEAEAEEMAKREHSTIEMMRRFFGDDLSLLKGDVLKKKARDYIYDNAVLE